MWGGSVFQHIFFICAFSGFTGVDQPYEKPTSPDLILDTVGSTVGDCSMTVVKLLQDNVKSRIYVYLPNDFD